MVVIQNMQNGSHGGVLSNFDAVFDDGWTIQRCVTVQHTDGVRVALPPLVAPKTRAVSIPKRSWFPFITAALAAYDDFRQSAEGENEGGGGDPGI